MTLGMVSGRRQAARPVGTGRGTILRKALKGLTERYAFMAGAESVRHRKAVRVLDDEAHVVRFLERPGWREATRASRHALQFTSRAFTALAYSFGCGPVSGPGGGGGFAGGGEAFWFGCRFPGLR
jgi:hypothetical protein